ncbi:topoisomerase II-associated protein PAT1 [Phellopilus nigrolimitatus]|nr:topoisomerase II-associated protein PAT1 [Phellopilus nigrolimitatus]
MSFFGLENSAFDDEKRRFLAGGPKEEEDIAVYNWGAEDYDGLGNALQEGGDDLNDETFGASGPVGKDFDFAARALPDAERPFNQARAATGGAFSAREVHAQAEPARPSQPARQTHTSRESIWEDKSPFSVLRTASSIGRRSGSSLGHHATPSTSSVSRPAAQNVLRQHTQSPALAHQAAHAPLSHAHPQNQIQGEGMINYAAPGMRSLAEIEAEMRMASQRSRDVQTQEQLFIQQQQQQQMKPPRMRSQSPSPFPNASANVPHAAYPMTPGAMEGYRPQHVLLQEVDNMRAQEANRFLRNEAIEMRNHELIEPVDVLLHRAAERERELPPGIPRTPRRFEEVIDHQELERRHRLQNVDDFQANLRRQITADQRRHAQLAAAGLLDQRRDSPSSMDSLQHQIRLALANEMASKARGENPPNIFGASPADIAQVQMQQRLLAQMAHQQFSQDMVGLDGLNGQGIPLSALGAKNQDALRAEAMRKIMEAERQEGRRRRKAAKIAHMSRYNDLMTQSDKDFITRIQVSQLVTSDPYTEDFYAQVYGSLLRSRMGINANEERVLKFGSGEGVGLGLNQRGGNRRPNAMQRMEAQVERIVNNARQREKEKGLHAIHSLQGALGKTAGRSYKAAPRQLLQVDTNGSSEPVAHAHGHISKDSGKENAAGAAKEAAKRGREALGAHGDSQGVVRKDPLTRRECLVILENLYDTLLQVEQMRREQPAPEDEARMQEWEEMYKAATTRLWDGLQVMVPLETSDPHPFVSLMMPAKGKKLLPRLMRHLTPEQTLLLNFLIIACFSQFDVVKNTAILDSQEDTPARSEVDRQTQTFLSTVLQSILPVIAKANLKLIGGMLGLLMERSEVHFVARSRPGLSLLTALLSRVEVIKSDMMVAGIEPSEIPSDEDLLSWQNISEHLFHILAQYLLSLFPSARIPSLKTVEGVSTLEADRLDQPVWKFLATLSLHAGNEQQQALLVTTLREKILDNVLAVSKGYVTDEEERTLKITNVNIFLHALGLDSSQISL